MQTSSPPVITPNRSQSNPDDMITLPRPIQSVGMDLHDVSGTSTGQTLPRERRAPPGTHFCPTIWWVYPHSATVFTLHPLLSTFSSTFVRNISPFSRLPTHGHDRPCRRDVGRVFLAGVRPDSPLRRRIPSCYCSGPGRGAAVEMGQRSVHQAHTTPVNSVHVSAPRADMFGDSVCAREADGTAAESWYVPLYEGVHPVCRLDSATGWRSGCRRAGGLVEPFVREKIQDWNRSA